MKNIRIFSLISTFMLLVIMSASANADDFEFVYYYGPGGGVDTTSAPVREALIEQGLSVSKVYFKTCSEAVNYAHKDPDNRVVAGIASDMHSTETGRCPSRAKSGLDWVTTIASAPMFMCTTPKNADMTLDAVLNSGETIIVGTTTADLPWLTTKAFINYNINNVDIKLVPYDNGGELRVATMSGSDIDLFVSSFLVGPATEAGAKCIASSSSQNHLRLPHTGKFVKNVDYPDFFVDFSLFSPGGMNQEKHDLLNKAFESEIFKSYMNKNDILTHQGAITGVSVDEQFTNAVAREKALDYFREKLK